MLRSSHNFTINILTNDFYKSLQTAWDEEIVKENTIMIKKYIIKVLVSTILHAFQCIAKQFLLQFQAEKAVAR